MTVPEVVDPRRELLHFNVTSNPTAAADVLIGPFDEVIAATGLRRATELLRIPMTTSWIDASSCSLTV